MKVYGDETVYNVEENDGAELLARLNTDGKSLVMWLRMMECTVELAIKRGHSIAKILAKPPKGRRFRTTVGHDNFDHDSLVSLSYFHDWKRVTDGKFKII